MAILEVGSDILDLSVLAEQIPGDSPGRAYALAMVPELTQAIQQIGDGMYVFNGDIGESRSKTGGAMWLRDGYYICAALHLLHDPLQDMRIEQVILTSARCLLEDMYANAILAGDIHRPLMQIGDRMEGKRKLPETTWERKFAADTPAYFLRLLRTHSEHTGKYSLYETPLIRQTIDKILGLFICEQDPAHSLYTYYRYWIARVAPDPTMQRTGMVRTAFLSSDDRAEYPYDIGMNLLILEELYHLMAILPDTDPLQSKIHLLGEEIKQGISTHGIVNGGYASQVDGKGGYTFTNDPNLPISALSYLAQHVIDQDVLQYTLRYFFTSPKYNKNYRKWNHIVSLTSVHTGNINIWPLGMMFTAYMHPSQSYRYHVLEQLIPILRNGHMPESFDPDNPNMHTRDLFYWPDALYILLAARG